MLRENVALAQGQDKHSLDNTPAATYRCHTLTSPDLSPFNSHVKGGVTWEE